MLSQVLYFLAAFSFYVLLSKGRTQQSSAKHFFNLQSAVIVFKKCLFTHQLNALNTIVSMALAVSQTVISGISV